MVANSYIVDRMNMNISTEWNISMDFDVVVKVNIKTEFTSVYHDNRYSLGISLQVQPTS